jgi:hypothetical protein
MCGGGGSVVFFGRPLGSLGLELPGGWWLVIAYKLKSKGKGNEIQPQSRRTGPQMEPRATARHAVSRHRHTTAPAPHHAPRTTPHYCASFRQLCAIPAACSSRSRFVSISVQRGRYRQSRDQGQCAGIPAHLMEFTTGYLPAVERHQGQVHQAI